MVGTAEQQVLFDSFHSIIWDFYHKSGRHFPWRQDHQPYRVFVSEVMLQQTQTDRVLQKFDPFLEMFPDFETLASATLRDVLGQWQGLGYNRRGLFLHRAAQMVVNEYGGFLPADPLLVDALPGIGAATAASICAFAYNVPTVFIETNIRSVFIKIFGGQHKEIDDKDILPLVEKTLDRSNPREWYYALMDYGVMIKKAYGNPNRQSKQYSRQSSFEGSDRQIRGQILRFLLNEKVSTSARLCDQLNVCPERFERIIDGLRSDGLINEEDGHLVL